MGKSCKKIAEEIRKDNADIKIMKSETKKTHMENGIVYLADDDYKLDNMVSLFNLLHEIGHARTNEKWMARSEREWRATTWAIFYMNKYGVKIPQWRKDNFQEDIYFWYEFEKSLLKAKPRMKKPNLKLFWREEE